MATARTKAKKVSCESCYFKCNLLCALNVDEPCVTYRPDSPEGLKPPRQMTLELALEYIEDDELVEVTPRSIRMRKTYLKESDRKKIARQEKDK